jgi:hypothetical protein
MLKILFNLEIKSKLNPHVKGPNWNIPFHIHTNALEKSLGVVLNQHEVIENMSFITPTKISLELT